MTCEKKLLICQDSMEGIFSAVYDGWIWGARGYQIEIYLRTGISGAVLHLCGNSFRQ